MVWINWWIASLKPHNLFDIKCYKSHHYHQNIKTDSKMSVLKTQTQALVELPCCQLCRAYTLLNLLPSKSNLSFAKLTVVKRGLVNKLSLGCCQGWFYHPRIEIFLGCCLPPKIKRIWRCKPSIPLGGQKTSPWNIDKCLRKAFSVITHHVNISWRGWVFGPPKEQEANNITFFWFLMENSIQKIVGSVDV